MNKIDDVEIKIIDYCGRIFNECHKLIGDEGTSILRNTWDNCLVLLDKIEGLKSTMIAQEVAYIKYALVAYIDEIFLAFRKSEEIAAWDLLQFKFFKTSNAGELFFKKLQEIENCLKNPNSVLAIYYICLQFGFKGKYKLYDEDKLIELKEILQKKLEESPSILKRNSSKISKLWFKKNHKVIMICCVIIFFIGVSGVALFDYVNLKLIMKNANSIGKIPMICQGTRC